MSFAFVCTTGSAMHKPTAGHETAGSLARPAGAMPKPNPEVKQWCVRHIMRQWQKKKQPIFDTELARPQNKHTLSEEKHLDHDLMSPVQVSPGQSSFQALSWFLVLTVICLFYLHCCWISNKISGRIKFLFRAVEHPHNFPTAYRLNVFSPCRDVGVDVGHCDVPSHPMLEWFCLKVLGASSLLCRTLDQCTKAFSYPPLPTGIQL